jgi:SAM-dependent methyltransferase
LISRRLLDIVRCPDCQGRFEGDVHLLRCSSCGREVLPEPDHLALVPSTSFEQTTKFVSESLHSSGRDETVSPPLLSAAVRLKMLQRFLEIATDDSVLDLGCGSGRFLVWNLGAGAHMVGIDAGPFFAAEARGSVDLMVGDLRRLPLVRGCVTKAYSLDVFEHLSQEDLVQALREANRVLVPGGALFVYTHVNHRLPLQPLIQMTRAVARAFERLGLADLSFERLRKSDHQNPLRSFEHLHSVAETGGFRIQKITYYTPFFSGIAENVLVPVMAHAWARWTFRRVDESAIRTSRARAKTVLAKGGAAYWVLRALTAMSMLDVVLFGRLKAGPFFALLVKQEKDEGR